MSSLRSYRKGFSLVEVALALGIVGFALVAILGMLPVAVESARESRLQTRAAFIGRSVFENLFSGLAPKTVVQIGPTQLAIVDLGPLDPLPSTWYLTYDDSGAQLASSTPSNYETGQNMPSTALFVARLVLTDSVDGSSTKAELSVETPAVAKKENRRKYLFVSDIPF